MNPNETPLLANASDGGSPFAILQHDGFLVPYGTYPHKQGLQLFDKAAAEEIVATHNSTLSKITRFVTGATYPIYVGHPDLPGSKDSDKRAYGWIENMRVTEEGLHLSAKWSDAGRDLVENAHFKFYSPLWWTKKVKGGIRPISLKSMGLTNDPNIPVPALANESEMPETRDQKPEGEESQTEQQTTESMKPEILAALGLEEGATPEEVLAKITELKDAASAANTEKSELETAKADAEAKATEYEGKKTEAENALATAHEKITALETGLEIAAGNAVAAAVQAGRITPADAEVKKAELLAANDLQAALDELIKLPVVMKTTSATGDLGTAKARLVIAANDESAAAKAERATLVDNEFQNTNPALSLGERKRIAWNRARAKNPELFGVKAKESSGSAA
jgi:hypothetical protein